MLPEPLPLLLFLPVPFCPGITFVIDVCAFWVLEELAYLPEVFREFWEVLGMTTNFAPLDVIMVFPEVMAFSSFLYLPLYCSFLPLAQNSLANIPSIGSPSNTFLPPMLQFSSKAAHSLILSWYFFLSGLGQSL